MSANALGPVARTVLDCYPFFRNQGQLIALGNRGGFSGARLWRVEGLGSALCLRAWPAQGITPDRLAWIHRLMRLGRKAGLHFVPDVLATSEGTTCVTQGERFWDLTTWMPGCADFHQHPTPERLEAACTALAHLHGAWAGGSPKMDRCPAVHRRMEAARDWDALLRSGWQPDLALTGNDILRSLAELSWSLLQTWAKFVPFALCRLEDQILPLQPCLCDIWHDHVLFEGSTVTGIIDYGGIKNDHVAVDLARLLGSMVGWDAERRTAGLRAYIRVRPLSWEEEPLVDILDETGTIVGLMNWLRWLYHEGRSFDDHAAVASRLAALVGRFERSG
jgi:Ser/Thr protein kinase RdoA (MazF antagonist)